MGEVAAEVLVAQCEDGTSPASVRDLGFTLRVRASSGVAVSR
jgi:hypothetical protein